MWVGRGLTQTEKVEGTIVRVTKTQFIVKTDEEWSRELKFYRNHEWQDSDFRRQVGHTGRRNPSRCYPNPITQR
jgi:hypothetical protein